jgi:hypothetical protein
MTHYRVSFFKKLVNSEGRCLTCLKHTFEVRARNIDRAVLAAKRRYARLHRLPEWRLCADSFEVHAFS